MSFSILTFNDLQAQEIKVSKIEKTKSPISLNYKSSVLYPQDNNGLLFYETRSGMKEDYYLVQAFYDDNLKITKTKEIYFLGDRKKSVSKGGYEYFYIFSEIADYLRTKIEVSENLEFFTVSYAEKENNEFVCVVDVFQNSEKINTLKFNPKGYEGYKLIELVVSNNGEVYIVGFKKDEKEKLHSAEKLFSVFELTKNGLSEINLNLNSDIKLTNINIAFNKKNELFIVSPYRNSDKQNNNNGIAISKLKGDEASFDYIHLENINPTINNYLSPFSDYKATLQIAPNGDIIYTLPTTTCIFDSPCMGGDINILSFSEDGDFQFIQTIEKEKSSVGVNTKTYLLNEGIYIIHNDPKSEDGIISKVCKINYEGKLEFQKGFTEKNNNTDFCMPGMTIRLSETKFLYYLYHTDEYARILEIIK